MRDTILSKMGLSHSQEIVAKSTSLATFSMHKDCCLVNVEPHKLQYMDSTDLTVVSGDPQTQNLSNKEKVEYYFCSPMTYIPFIKTIKTDIQLTHQNIALDLFIYRMI